MAVSKAGQEWPDWKRFADQLDLIRTQLPDVGIDPPDWSPQSGEAPKYLFREGVILVRDADLPRVGAVVPGYPKDSLIRGVTQYAVQGMSTLEALDRIEAALGRNVVTPDHVVSVCPRSFCPAIEPEPSAAIEPNPSGSGAAGCDGRGVLVGVVDTGWLRGAEKVPWLKGVTGDPEGAFAHSGLIGPYVGHGTFIAGVIRSIASGCDVYVDRVPQQAAGAWYESDMIRQLDNALARGASVISLSAGTNTRGDHALLAFEAWYETSLKHRRDVVFVAAAGNDGESRPFWPAAFDWALSVGATDLNGTVRAPFSNFGPWVRVFAPGDGIVNAYAKGTYRYNEGSMKGKKRQFDGVATWSGTSFAAPLVAGLIAARMSGTGATAPEAAAELLQLARGRTVPGLGPVLMPEMACEATACGCGCGCVPAAG